jgi:hypothetical protein
MNLKGQGSPHITKAAPCLNLGTLLKKCCTLLEIFSKTSFSLNLEDIKK